MKRALFLQPQRGPVTKGANICHLKQLLVFLSPVWPETEGNQEATRMARPNLVSQREGGSRALAPDPALILLLS